MPAFSSAAVLHVPSLVTEIDAILYPPRKRTGKRLHERRAK